MCGIAASSDPESDAGAETNEKAEGGRAEQAAIDQRGHPDQQRSAAVEQGTAHGLHDSVEWVERQPSLRRAEQLGFPDYRGEEEAKLHAAGYDLLHVAKAGA